MVDPNDPVLVEYRDKRRRELVSLREKIVASPPGPEINAEIFETLDNGMNEIVEVTRTVIDHVDGEEDRRTEKKILCGWKCESSGYVAENGEVVWWAGRPPSFWEELWDVPRYTTDYDTAHQLSWCLLASRGDLTSHLEEIKKQILIYDDEPAVTPAFRASIRDTDGNSFPGPVVDRPAVALLLATLDYLIANDP